MLRCSYRNKDIVAVYYRFHKDNQKYYEVRLQRDLLGDLVVTRAWGNIGKPNGRIKSDPVKNMDEGLKLLSQISKRRIQCNYHLVI